MNIRTFPAKTLDMVRFEIETGATYNGPQVVSAILESADSYSGGCILFFLIADDSRCMYEQVKVAAPWSLIRSCQNTTKDEDGISRMAGRIMHEYLNSNYTAK